MTDNNVLTRREFNLQWAVAILIAATIAVGCGENAGSPTTPTQPGDVLGSISANHGHIAILHASDFNSTRAIAVDIRGNATHPHLIELTVSQLTTISSGGRVSVVSSLDDGHSHTVTFN